MSSPEPLRGPRRLLAAGWVGAIVLATIITIEASRGQVPQPRPPNIVFIVSDDQRWDSLKNMPTVESQLVGKGVRYAQSVVTNSLCCPSRSTILTGDYSHTTGVWTNEDVHYGGWPAFHASGFEDHTVAAWLSDAGYTTGLFGKYLNEYPGGIVPYGWDAWDSFAGNPGYYNYRMFSNANGGTLRHYGEAPGAYSTRVIGAAADEFITQMPGNQPLFAYVAPFAPHGPARPDPDDAGSMQDKPLPDPPNFNEQDVSDKPGYIQDLPPLSQDRQHSIRHEYQHELASLRGVDRMVAGVISSLRASGRLNNTLIIYTSDNGVANGEHRWYYKLTPYEESVRVPLVMRWDGHIAPGTVSQDLASNVDLAPTMAEAAGAAQPPTDGSPLLDGRFRSRSQLLEHLHYRSDKPDPPDFCGLRTMRWTYVRYDTGEEELYDRRGDPYELHNVAYTKEMRKPVVRFRRQASRSCMPRPPGWTDAFLEHAPLGG